MEDTQSKRISEIKELGLMCYNIMIDKSDLPQPLTDKAELLSGQIQNNGENKDDEIQEALLDLGCTCYNLYVEKKLDREDLVDKCKAIDELNKSIIAESSVEEVIKAQPDLGFGGDAGYNSYNDNNEELTLRKDDFAPESESDIKHSGFVVNHPYGMEPIPNGYKRCKCGYRNRAYANFCGKCGATLRSGG